jgi:hypothetical protein
MAMLTFSLTSNVSKKKLILNCININIPNTSPAVKYANKNERNVKAMKYNCKKKKEISF